jgi:hypothetical protein
MLPSQLRNLLKLTLSRNASIDKNCGADALGDFGAPPARVCSHPEPSTIRSTGDGFLMPRRFGDPLDRSATVRLRY